MSTFLVLKTLPGGISTDPKLPVEVCQDSPTVLTTGRLEVEVTETAEAISAATQAAIEEATEEAVAAINKVEMGSAEAEVAATGLALVGESQLRSSGNWYEFLCIVNRTIFH